MDVHPTVVETARWYRTPGVLELQERGHFKDANSARSHQGMEAGIQLLSVLYPDALTSRVRTSSRTLELSSDVFRQVGLEGDRVDLLIQPTSWWQDLLNWLNGYHKDVDLVNHQLTWVPIVEVHMPPGGTAKVVFSQSVKTEVKGEFKIIGSGLGTSGSFSIKNKLTIPADVIDKALFVQLVVTLTRYVSKAGPPIYRLDVDAQDTVPIGIGDLPPIATGPSGSQFDPKTWNILREVDLSHGSDPKPAELEYSRSGEASWEVDLGVSLELPAKLELTTKVSFSKSDDWTTTYEVPFGYYYMLYGRPHETPLVPYVVRLDPMEVAALQAKRRQGSA